MSRELIKPHAGDKRFVQSAKKGKRHVDAGRSLSADRRSKAKTMVKE
jgi:hypothetical protein